MGYIEELRSLVGTRPLILPGACVLLFDEQGRVLLQHRSDGGWGLPGGFMEPGERLKETAHRELREETGLEAGDLTLLGIFSGPEFFHTYPNGDQVHNVTAAYAGNAAGGLLQADGDESLAVEFFAPSALPAGTGVFARALLQHYLGLKQA